MKTRTTHFEVEVEVQNDDGTWVAICIPGDETHFSKDLKFETFKGAVSAGKLFEAAGLMNGAFYRIVRVESITETVRTVL